VVDENLKSRIRGAARARDFTKVDELWAELVAQTAWRDDPGLFTDVANDLSERGEKERAGQLLLALLEDMKKEGNADATFDLARKTAKFSPKGRGLREELVSHYRRVYADRTGLEACLKRSGILSDGPCDKAVQVLDDSLRFAAGDFCSHASGWGIGRVVEATPETGEYVIDFMRRRGQRMAADMTRTSVEKRDPDDLDVLLWTDKPKVKTLAEEDPLQLLKSALKSATAGKLQARDLREKLEGEILDKNSWTKFWARARKLAKDDPWIEVGAAPKSVIAKRAQPLSREAEVSKTVDKAGPFLKKLEAARRELLAIAKDAVAKGVIPSWLKTGVAAMQKDVETPPRGKPSPHHAIMIRAMQLEFAMFKLEAANLMPQAASEMGVQAPDAAAAALEAVDPETGEPLGPEARPSRVPAQVAKALEGITVADLPHVLREMSVQEYRRRLVGLVRIAFTDWQERLRAVLLDPAPGTFETCARELMDGAQPVMDDSANKIVISPTKYPDAYAALVRARFNGRLGELAAKRSDTELVAKAIQLLDDVTHRLRGQSEKGEKGSLKTAVDALRALFSEKSQRVIGTVIKNGAEAEVRRILQLVRQSPSLTPTVIRATEAFVANKFPDLLGTVVAAPRVEKDADAVEERLYTTQEGLTRRRAEYDRIVNVDLEEVRLEIGRALEFGDISENSELDAAREHQRNLAVRIERMRTELERVVIIDPATVEPDEVRIGTRVVLKPKGQGKEETYTVLGPWDADEAHHVISYLSPIARAILGRKLEDEVDVLLPDGSKARFQIRSIERAATTRQHQVS
jgi:transcription elongation GreA/GreB family factor